MESGLDGTYKHYTLILLQHLVVNQDNKYWKCSRKGGTDFSSLTTMTATDADGKNWITILHQDYVSGIIQLIHLLPHLVVQPQQYLQTHQVQEKTFTVTATDAKSNAVSRQFKITVLNVLLISAQWWNTTSDDGNFRVHTFNNSSNFVVSSVG